MTKKDGWYAAEKLDQEFCLHSRRRFAIYHALKKFSSQGPEKESLSWNIMHSAFRLLIAVFAYTDNSMAEPYFQVTVLKSIQIAQNDSILRAIFRYRNTHAAIATHSLASSGHS